jgi:hypothetical protein
MFRNLFLVLVPDADPEDRAVHADDLSETTIVPVTTMLFGLESLQPAAAYRARFEKAVSQTPNG